MKTPRLNLIVAMARNRTIGRNNTLPWRLPEDLQFFKRTTLGHPIIMGRNTYESIGRPLPGRRNIVVSRQENYRAAGCEVVSSLEAALALCQSTQDVFVIGGSQLYALALPQAERLYVTEIKQEVEGDAHFPPFEHLGFNQTHRETHQATAPNTFAFDFVTYEKTPIRN